MNTFLDALRGLNAELFHMCKHSTNQLFLVFWSSRLVLRLFSALGDGISHAVHVGE
jgi:hypothetical protein